MRMRRWRPLTSTARSQTWGSAQTTSAGYRYCIASLLDTGNICILVAALLNTVTTEYGYTAGYRYYSIQLHCWIQILYSYTARYKYSSIQLHCWTQVLNSYTARYRYYTATLLDTGITVYSYTAGYRYCIATLLDTGTIRLHCWIQVLYSYSALLDTDTV